MEILICCTANRCRSPLAAALLRRLLDERGIGDVKVRSRGEMHGGEPVTKGTMRSAAALGVDLGVHRSRQIERHDVARADLVLGMARRHVRHAAVLVPDAFGRCFTLKELVRRAAAVGPRPLGEPVPDWLDRVSGDRTRADLLGDAPQDDVADPIGGGPQAYARVAAELEQLLRRLVDLGFSVPVAGTSTIGA